MTKTYKKPDNPTILTNVTLRDLFAAAALTGSLSHPQSLSNEDVEAAYAYRLADAMLAERKKGSEDD